MACFGCFAGLRRGVLNQPQAPLTPDCTGKTAQCSEGLTKEDGWRTTNELSIASTSTTASSTSTPASELFTSELEEQSDLDLVDSEIEHETCCMTVKQECLFFRAHSDELESTHICSSSCSSSSSGNDDSNGKLVRVETFCYRPSSSTIVARGPPDVAGESSGGVPAARVLVDCRVEEHEDPKLVALLGTLLCDGRRTRRLLWPSAPGAEAAADDCRGLVCELARGPGDAPAGEVTLEEAISEICEAQRQRERAKTELYQRQLNARLLGARRRQALGLP